MTTPPALAAVLDFEAEHPAPGGRKEELIRQAFGISAARYYQLLHRYADSLEGQQHDPRTTNRIRRQREADTATRERRTRT